MPAKVVETFPFVESAIFKSRECGYISYSDVTFGDIFYHNVTLAPICDENKKTAVMVRDAEIFDGNAWSRWTSYNWQYPLVACVLYGIMLLGLKLTAKNRDKKPLTHIVWVWNFGLALFSIIGAAYCVPRLLFGPDAGLFTMGFYPSVCAPALSYGYGHTGFWVALFIYSKFAELLDTLWLLLRKREVIILHWYHHFTVLLYCWHSYSVRIGTGLWFASMNYCVHSIMYFYYGLSEFRPRGRKIAASFAQLVTIMQLSQMVVGITVTVSSMVYHASGKDCYVSIVNSVLGLLMYTSYFLLFFQLYVQKYGLPGMRQFKKK